MTMPGISRDTHDRYPLRRQVRTPAGRVAAIAAWFAATAAVVAGIAAGSVAVILAGAIAWMLAMGAVNVAGGGLTVMRTSELDEREVRDRERVFAIVHRALSLALVLTVVVADAAAGATVRGETLVAVLAAVALLQLAGPSLLLAARARADEPDEL